MRNGKLRSTSIFGAVHDLLPRVVDSLECPAESREPNVVSRFQFSIANIADRKLKSAIGIRLSAFGKTPTLGTES